MDIDLAKDIKKITQDLLVRSTTVVMDKGVQDIVTNQDFEMERAIKAYLRMHYPQDTFIGEEENQWHLTNERRSEERRVGKQSRSRWWPDH